MQRRTIPDWAYALIFLAAMAGIVWLCVTAGG